MRLKTCKYLTMKQIQLVLIILFLPAFPIFLKAQLNIGPEFSKPVQGFEEHAPMGGGQGVLMEVPIMNKLGLVGHLGHMHWSFKEPSENRSLSLVSIQAGLRYNITPKFYVQGFAGGYTAFLRTRIYGIPVRSRVNNHGWALGAGFLANKYFDLGARLQLVDKLGFVVIQGHFRIANILDKM